MPASDSEAREFAAAFRSFLEWVHADQSGGRRRNEVAALVSDHLGEGAAGRSVVARSLPVFEHVNLQTALDAWAAEPGREVAVHGISIPPHHPPVSLQQLIAGEGMPALRLSAPALADLPNGPRSTLACLRLAALLVSDDLGRYVVMVIGPGEHHHGLAVEIAGLPVDAAQAVHARLEELRRALNVYRGHVIDDDPSAPVVGAAHASRALDDLLDGGQRLTRSLLGVGNDPASLPAGGGVGSLPPQRGRRLVAGYGQPPLGPRRLGG